MSNFFEVDFLEAGEKSSGDAICLRYRDVNDYTHVVDGGYKDDGDSIAAHIRKYYEEEIFVDHVVLTHPDGDHAAGLKTVLEEFNVGYLWMNRPWEHVSVLLGRFNYDYTETGLRQRLRKDFPHTAELEDIADERGIEIRHAFQGAQIGAFTVLAPSVERYLDLIVDSEKTPEPERAAAMKGRIYERVMTILNEIGDTPSEAADTVSMFEAFDAALLNRQQAVLHNEILLERSGLDPEGAAISAPRPQLYTF